MKCRFCGEDQDYYFDIPNDLKIKGRNKSTISCRKCGIERGIICQKHELMHYACGDGHACMECINNTLVTFSHYDFEVACVIRESLSVKQVEDIEDWASIHTDPIDIRPDSNITCVVVICFYVYKSLYGDCPCPQLSIDTFESEKDFIIRMMNRFYPASAVA